MHHARMDSYKYRVHTDISAKIFHGSGTARFLVRRAFYGKRSLVNFKLVHP